MPSSEAGSSNECEDIFNIAVDLTVWHFLCVGLFNECDLYLSVAGQCKSVTLVFESHVTMTTFHTFFGKQTESLCNG